METEAISAPYRVRNFGNDRDYDSVEALIEGLAEHYRGESVAVHVRTPAYGMTRPFFVDVAQNGQLLETYGETPNKTVDIDTLREAAAL